MTPTYDAQEAEYLRILKTLKPDESKIVIDALKDIENTERVDPSTPNNLVDALAGRTFSRQERLQLEIKSLVRYFQRRRELLQDALTASEVAELLGASRQTPHDRVKGQTLLGLLDNGVLRFPMWQFDPEGPNGIIDGLPETLKALNLSDFAKLNWLVRPNPFLDQLTPVEALRQGQKERVIQEATFIYFNKV